MLNVICVLFVSDVLNVSHVSFLPYVLNVICVLFVSDVLNVSHVSFVPYVPYLMCIFFVSPYEKTNLFEHMRE